MRYRRLWTASAIVVLAAPVGLLVGQPAYGAAARVWTEPAHTSVFADSGPSGDSGGTVDLDMARNESEAAQVVLRCDQACDINDVTFTDLTGSGGSIGGAELSYSFVGYQSLDRNTMFGAQEMWPVVRKAPGKFPDRLLNQRKISRPAGTTQSIWVRVHTPPNLRGGVYTGKVTVWTSLGNFPVVISADVRDIALPEPKDSAFTTSLENRLLGTQSWDEGEGDWLEQFYSVAHYSPEWWALIDKAATLMKANRSNGLTLPITRLLIDSGTTVDDQGHYTFKFDRMDEAVDHFLRNGSVKRLEGYIMTVVHDGDPNVPPDKWSTPLTEMIDVDPNTGEMRRAYDDWDSPKTANWISQFIPALRAHVQQQQAQKNWPAWWMHVGDEPKGDVGRAAWFGIAAKYRTYWPDVQLADATFDEPTSTDVAKNANIMIPNELNYNVDGQAYDEEREQTGKELWFYNCNIPVFHYLNRFIDQPQWNQRVTMWWAYSRNMTGYLHWALDDWHVPLDDQDQKGDHFITQPDKANQAIESTTRYESLRDGIEDWEILNIIGRTRPGLAHDLAASLAWQADRYVADTGYMRRIRRLALDAAAGKPLIASDPARGAQATASSAAVGFTADKAVDGNGDTGWRPANGNNTQWIKVQLGQQAQVDGVHLKWGSTFARSYHVEISFDGVRWTDAAQITSDGGDDFIDLNAKAKFIRVTTTGSSGSGAYTLTDLEVAGTSLASPNLAGGKTYEKTDSAGNPAVPDYPDAANESTDGIMAGPYDEERNYGYQLTETNNEVLLDVTVDLGRQEQVGKVRVHAYEEYPDYRSDNLTVSTSTDNITFTPVGTMTTVNGESGLWYNFAFTQRTARYVQVTFQKSYTPTATDLFIDEIEAYAG